jgi:hypothetical protein
MGPDDQRAEQGEPQLRGPPARRAHQDREREQREAERELEVHEAPEEGAVVDQREREKRQPFGLAEGAQQGEDADRQQGQRDHHHDAHAQLERGGRRPSRADKRSAWASDPRARSRRREAGSRPEMDAAARCWKVRHRQIGERARGANRRTSSSAEAAALRDPSPSLRADRPLAQASLRPRVLPQRVGSGKAAAGASISRTRV